MLFPAATDDTSALTGGAFVCVILPLWEYRHSLAEIFGHMWADIRGKRAEA